MDWHLAPVRARALVVFPSNAAINIFTLVALPPRLAKLATRPSLTGSTPLMKTKAIVFAAAWPTQRAAHSDFRPTDETYGDVSDVRRIQSVPNPLESSNLRRGFLERTAADKADHRFRRLLRADRKRPNRRCGAQYAEEIHVASSAAPCFGRPSCWRRLSTGKGLN